MQTLKITSRVGPDGVLRVPMAREDADREVVVTVEPAPAQMTPEEWSAWARSMVGSIDDPTFVRHDQGIVEERDPL
jgi:hypothetical protein